jgi:charged multivesicular body protein 4
MCDTTPAEDSAAVADEPTAVADDPATTRAASPWRWMGAVASVFGAVTGFVAQYVMLPWSGGDYDKRRMADAIAKLQHNLQFLDGKIESMEASCRRYTAAARVLYKAQNKTAAVHQIRLKKMYEREIRKMESLKFNIESNILHIESVGVMMETVCTIKETSDHFQIVQRHVDISKLENTIEEMCEQRDASHDIESILSDMHSADRYDDADLLQELEDLVNPAESGAAAADQKPADAPPPAPTAAAAFPAAAAAAAAVPEAALRAAFDAVPAVPATDPQNSVSAGQAEKLCSPLS